MVLPSAPVISSTNVENIGSYNVGLLSPSLMGGGASVKKLRFIVKSCKIKDQPDRSSRFKLVVCVNFIMDDSQPMKI